MDTTLNHDEIALLMKEGQDAVEAGAFDQALAAYSTITLLNPDHADALTMEGVVLLELEERQEAELKFDLALQRAPKHPVARLHRGLLRMRRGDRAGRDDLVAAVEGDPQLRTHAAQRAKALLSTPSAPCSPTTR